jgi:hypothetical protein
MLPNYLKPFLNKVTFQDYKKARSRRGIPNAKSALHNACYQYYSQDVKRRFAALGGETKPDYEASDDWESGDSRLRIVESAEDYMSWDDLVGDTFCPKANPDIKPEILEREEQEYSEKVRREGVWYYDAQIWNGDEWQSVDSIGGFVGDGFIGSNYDDDLMESAMDALVKCIDETAQEIAQEIESERPDLYAA